MIFFADISLNNLPLYHIYHIYSVFIVYVKVRYIYLFFTYTINIYSLYAHCVSSIAEFTFCSLCEKYRGKDLLLIV